MHLYEMSGPARIGWIANFDTDQANNVRDYANSIDTMDCKFDLNPWSKCWQSV
ncbi:hypothetical protein V1280_003697 [Bradyrhizobium sp. AZCC 2230]